MYITKLAALKTIKEKDTIISLTNELKIYKSLLNSIPDGQEGIAAGIPKIVVGVIDVFLRIGNTFKTNITKFYKQLKRSEIKYFTESNRLKVAKVEDTPYAKFINIKTTSMPSGMVGMYIPAIENIEDIYAQLAIYDTIIPLVKKLTSLQRLIMDKDPGVSVLLEDLAHTSNIRQDLINKVVDKNKVIFTDKKTPDNIEFSKLYKTMVDFKLVRSKLTELESQLNTTMKVSDLIVDVDSDLINLVNYLTNHQTDLAISKQFVENLIDVINYAGNGVDTQGRTALQQMALEHNHILNINELYKVL